MAEEGLLRFHVRLAPVRSSGEHVRPPVLRHVDRAEAPQRYVVEPVLVHTLGHHLTAHVRDGLVGFDAYDVHADIQERSSGEPRIHANVVAKAVDDFVKRRLRRHSRRHAVKLPPLLRVLVVIVGRHLHVILPTGELVLGRLVELGIRDLNDGAHDASPVRHHRARVKFFNLAAESLHAKVVPEVRRDGRDVRGRGREEVTVLAVRPEPTDADVGDVRVTRQRVVVRGEIPRRVRGEIVHQVQEARVGGAESGDRVPVPRRLVPRLERVALVEGVLLHHRLDARVRLVFRAEEPAPHGKRERFFRGQLSLPRVHYLDVSNVGKVSKVGDELSLAFLRGGARVDGVVGHEVVIGPRERGVVEVGSEVDGELGSHERRDDHGDVRQGGVGGVRGGVERSDVEAGVGDRGRYRL
mmetsp:Transcript_8421/g.34420  ORF Transcript_8421/g.34420 Transcript_8421/m.34420 type:complete len:411 (-) Transcript_8421:356-1588(-)